MAFEKGRIIGTRTKAGVTYDVVSAGAGEPAVLVERSTSGTIAKQETAPRPTVRDLTVELSPVSPAAGSSGYDKQLALWREYSPSAVSGKAVSPLAWSSAIEAYFGGMAGIIQAPFEPFVRAFETGAKQETIRELAKVDVQRSYVTAMSDVSTEAIRTAAKQAEQATLATMVAEQFRHEEKLAQMDIGYGTFEQQISYDMARSMMGNEQWQTTAGMVASLPEEAQVKFIRNLMAFGGDVQRQFPSGADEAYYNFVQRTAELQRDFPDYGEQIAAINKGIMPYIEYPEQPIEIGAWKALPEAVGALGLPAIAIGALILLFLLFRK